MKQQISIIIPTLNEAETITHLLNYLIENSSKENIKDIIVVDGGSNDGTQQLASQIKNITLLNSEKGRAKQLNYGAKYAEGNILYFLHADSFPPKNFDTLIISEVLNGNEAGCFRMKFDSNHWWLKLAGWLTILPWKSCRGGDQSQFITTSLFKEIEGYNEQFSIYEDNDLIEKLYARKQFVVIQKWLTTSARCYEKYGIWRTQYYFWRIHLKSRLGASPRELTSYYKNNLIKT
ncbi:TIGR04283 family arsenosugar biosynthesis glycosyltransferase [Algibacter sp. 2305UL17-15]|uniref:TIGR04283 family arsenosugar biosynthesis glycosyltransferase n=1 Tax=Algibacter sp. 2305UL17-15 TaxID=3231268 RepID=UPI0034584DD2